MVGGVGGIDFIKLAIEGSLFELVLESGDEAGIFGGNICISGKILARTVEGRTGSFERRKQLNGISAEIRRFEVFGVRVKGAFLVKETVDAGVDHLMYFGNFAVFVAENRANNDHRNHGDDRGGNELNHDGSQDWPC